MATSAARSTPAPPAPRLTVVRLTRTPRREQALSQARAARRRLEQRAQGGERFAYLRSAHD